MNRFAENLRRIRFERRMTQEEFATLLGTTKQNISRYESGAVSPKITTAQAIADKLGMTLSELNGTQPIDYFVVNDGKPTELTAATWAAREALMRDPARRTLLELAERGTAKDVQQVAALIDALKATNPDFGGDDD